MTVKVRGIYATALTELLRDVVQASPPIRERFDTAFPVAPADASVETTEDRQGVGVHGDPETVASVRDELHDVGIDAFAYDDPVAKGAVFDGVVGRSVGRGAVVDLGDAEGYLAFDDYDGYVEEGDRVRVQVAEPKPPWSSKRPVLNGEIRAFGDIAGLVRGRDALVASTPGGSEELARTTELLSPDVPENWAVEWGYAAADASMDELGDALEDAVTSAEELEGALDGGPDEPGRVASPASTAWVWFGRATRSELDDVRARVTATMPGHHRTKAGSASASTAVDFAENLGRLPESFPFAAVADAFGPHADETVGIEHGKPDGRLITLGRGDVVDFSADDSRIVVERAMTGGGTYDALDVPREEGDTAVTRFVEGRWWYPTVYRAEDGTVKGTYVNVNTPLELFPDGVRYVDLHVDVLKHADGTVEQVDRDELEACVDDELITRELAEKAFDVADRIENAFSK